MRITTVNVNGLRAAARKGMLDWVNAQQPDVLLMQEVRAPEEAIEAIFADSCYLVVNEISELKGRAGVSIAMRDGLEIAEVRRGLVPEEEPVDTGRWIEVDLVDPQLTVISAYLHSGVADKPEKMAAKYAHLQRVSERLASVDPAGHTLVAGDFNIVHTERDIKNWKSNHNKTSGVLDPEIAYLDQWFGAGWVDVQRRLLDGAGFVGNGPYTWWSQRGKAFDNDAGWRIDYQMATPALAERAGEFSIGRAASYGERWSDHAPLTVTYEL